MKKRIFMTLLRYFHPRGAVSFWHTSIKPVFYDYKHLGNYYIDLTAKTKYKGPFDSNGVPVLDYFGYIGRQYNPCAIAQWGIGGFQRFIEGEPEAEAVIRTATNWLKANLEVDSHGRGFWWYRFDFDAYGLKAPWGSALAQAQGISLLLRAHRLWGEDRDLEVAKQACAAMLAPVSEGGLCLKFDDYTVLEEVVSDRPTVILDGFMFAIFGLFDYCYVVDDANAKNILKNCLSTLEKLLPMFDLKYWSRADLYSLNPPMPSSLFYHRLHVAQLAVLGDLTGNTKFQDFSRMWAVVLDKPINRYRAFFNKTFFKFRYY